MLLVRGVINVLRRLHEGWRAHPRERRDAWARTLGLGFAVCMILSTSLSLAGRYYAGRGLDAWDAELLLQIVALNPLSFQKAVALHALGGAILLLPACLAAVVVAAKLGRPLVAATLLAAFLLQKALLFWSYLLWARPRPDLVAGGLAVPTELPAFPSGHLMQAVPLWGLLAYFWSRASGSTAEQCLAWFAFATAVTTVTLTRFALGVHWPSDVLAGAGLGGAWLVALIYAIRQAEPR